MAFVERSFGLQCHCYVAAVAGTMVYLCILDSGRGLGACEGVGSVGRFEGFAVVGTALERPEVEVADGPSLLYMFSKGRELVWRRRTLRPMSIPAGWP